MADAIYAKKESEKISDTSPCELLMLLRYICSYTPKKPSRFELRYQVFIIKFHFSILKWR